MSKNKLLSELGGPNIIKQRTILVEISVVLFGVNFMIYGGEEVLLTLLISLE
ncbi:hypothetical protein [Pediococcus argentinicus]|uniref:Uncharacterized protein n=1 Tax=Pediococcus argentinicus TaxID=480391 RepID=A0A0R2NJP8_9LACO|nr:hypothetical protein [Pediococcus argentinicus]KRO25999.1 hypothetical protein IV88_GL001267 [Pediococcus argentinicus]GEP18992.1 hypothetical protein LSA03_03760 [Pediococcus argentinicus]